MNYSYINARLNDIIASRIPKGKKVIPLLTDLLNFSRESAYRRFRNEIPYTMQEVAILASKLDISLDEIFYDNKEKAYFSLSIAKGISPMDNYVEMMKSTIKAITGISENQYVKVYYAGNTIPDGLLLHFKMLTKLRYIRWIHQTHNLAIDSKFSDIIIPPQVIDIHQRYLEASKKVNRYTAVFDNNIIQSIMSTISFYYCRNLIANNEMLELKKELLVMLDQLERISRTGKNKFNVDNYLYLSDLPIESNVTLFEQGEKVSAYLLSSGKKPIVTNNVKVYEDQKLWIDSLLKFSILITRSNKIFQTEFFTNQRNLIENQFMMLLAKE